MKNLAERFEQIQAVRAGSTHEILETLEFDVDFSVLHQSVTKPLMSNKDMKTLMQIQREHLVNIKHDAKMEARR
jgi:hypothetical protein